MKKKDAIFLIIMLMMAGFNLCTATDALIADRPLLGGFALLIAISLTVAAYVDMRNTASQSSKELEE